MSCMYYVLCGTGSHYIIYLVKQGGAGESTMSSAHATPSFKCLGLRYMHGRGEVTYQKQINR